MNQMKSELKPNLEIAKKVIETVDAGLCFGFGRPAPGQMCVEAALCFAFGLPHGDNPPCVGHAVRSLGIALSDCGWSSKEARAKGMRKFAVAQLGSDTIDQRKFSELLALKTIQKLCPQLFRELAKLAKTDADKQAMESAATSCETATDLKSAADNLAHALAHALARDRARDRDLDLDLALDLDLDFAITLARDLSLSLDLDFAIALARTRTLARTLALARALDLARNYDEALTLVADIALEVLIGLKSPGCQWLYLCEEQAEAQA